MAERRGDGSGQNSLNETANRRAKVRTRLLPERERERERERRGGTSREKSRCSFGQRTEFSGTIARIVVPEISASFFISSFRCRRVFAEILRSKMAERHLAIGRNAVVKIIW